MSESAKIKNMGVDGGHLDETIPEFARTDCEEVIQGKNNSYIVLGRDRPGNKHTGYGGKGKGECGMIDLVCGRMHSKDGAMSSFVKPDGTTEPILADPMFTPYRPLTHGQSRSDVPVTWASDAARIYISQMTDIDTNFGIHRGAVGISKAKSAVAMKADAIRIIGNEGIKIVTNVDKTNSAGYQTTKNGIDLIANNNGRKDNDETVGGLLQKGASLQPLVKGQNLRACLNEIVEELVKLQSSLQGLCNQVMMNAANIGSHTHPPPVLLVPICPSPELLGQEAAFSTTVNARTITSIKAHSQNLENIKSKFLKPNGKCFINSKYNKTN